MLTDLTFQFCSSNEFASKAMIKWPWKSNEAGRNTALPWDEALAIPVLANLPPDDQARLVQLADRFAAKTPGCTSGI
jgi:Mlc titration factor MtfA (ptsG expression regulator)